MNINLIYISDSSKTRANKTGMLGNEIICVHLCVRTGNFISNLLLRCSMINVNPHKYAFFYFICFQGVSSVDQLQFFSG